MLKKIPVPFVSVVGVAYIMYVWYVFGLPGSGFMVNIVKHIFWVPRDSEMYFLQSNYYR